MQRIDRELSQLLSTLYLLMKETDHATSLALRYTALQEVGRASHDEVRIAYKIAIRVLFTLVDATGTVLRAFITRAAKHQGRALPEKWKKKLSAEQLGADENLKIAFRFFPQVFGSDLAIDFSGRNWSDFRELAIVRHRMTHPRIIDDTLPPLGLALLVPVVTWFLGTLAVLLADAARKRGLEPPQLDLSGLERVERIAKPPERFFDDAAMQLIPENSARLFEYFQRFFFALADETSQVAKWFGESCKGAAPFDGEAQFGARILTITMFSEMEGVANVAQFFIEAAQARGAVTVTPGDLVLLREAGPATRYANVLTLWARLFGDGEEVARKGREWHYVGVASGYRDRFVHPAGSGDLRVSLDMLTPILGTLNWFNEAREALSVKPERLSALAWGGRSEIPD
jgi:hypothetical protein